MSAQELRTDLNTLATTHRPKTKGNVARVAAELATWKAIENMAKTTAEVIAKDIKENMVTKEMFADGNTADIYRNGSFAVTVTEKNQAKTFDRERAIIALATTFKLSAEDAIKFLDDNCYKGGGGAKTLQLNTIFV